MLRKFASLELLDSWRVPTHGSNQTLQKLAHRVEFEYEPRPGYLYVRSRMISSRTNDNHDSFPAEEIEKGWRTFIGKPVFVNHHNSNHRRARGVIVAAALHRDRNPDSTPDTWVEGLMEVDAARFPKLAQAIIAGRVNRTSMGVDVELSKCSACGNQATSPAEYCRHLPALKGKKIRKRAKDGRLREEIIHEICHGLSFFENSLLVEDPADPTAYVLGEVDTRGLNKAASRKTAAPSTPHPSRREAAVTSGADDDNLYALTGCHHTSCGRTLHRGRTAALEINESRLHGYTPDRAVEPVRHVLEGARAYNAKVGLPDPHAGSYAGVHTNPDRIKRLARAYDSLPMNDRNAHAAYDEMARQVNDQYHHLTHTMGVHVEGVDHDPYPDVHAMMHDLHHNKRLQYLNTASTGPHSYWDNDTNDKFRAVHDAFGHAATGRSFDRHGEEAAWLAHSRMFHGPARHAMTSETRGQNSVLIATGSFPEQKTALMPHELLRAEASMLTTAPPLSYVPLMAEAASRPAYPNPADHPFYQANPVSSHHIVNKYFAASDTERELGHRWYSDASHVAHAISGGDNHKGAGVLSSYSPQAGWPDNLFNASRAFHNHAKGEPIPGKGSGAMDMHRKAASRILNGESYHDVLRAPKTNAFAKLIEHGDDPPEDKRMGHSNVVIDRHAMSVAMGRRTTKDDDLSFLGNPHYYNHTADAYRQATHEINQKTGLNLAPHQVQAVTWGVQKRENDEAQANTPTGKGRISRERNMFRKWNEHAEEHHPDLPRGESGNMHVSVKQAYLAAIRTLAFGETKMPSQVDTLRMEACPVCGEQDVWSGQRCPVCGFVVPPSMFRDPDVDKAGEVRDELDQEGEVNLPSEAQEAAQEAPGAPQGSDPDADEQLTHPDQVAPDGVPAAQGPDQPLTPGQEMAAGEEQEAAGDQEMADAEAAALSCPQCGEQFGPADPGAEEGATCPACGNAALAPVAQEPLPRKGQQAPSGGTVMASAKEAAATAQLQRMSALERENASLRAQLTFLANLAGVGPELEQIRRQADVMNPAQPVPDPPEAPPTQTTEDALASGGARPAGQNGQAPNPPAHTVDDPSRPGTTPGSVSNVPATQTTTAITPGVEIATPPATNLVDVTAPTQGTNPSQDGGVPIEQRRIETDVRIDPNPLKAEGPGVGGMGTDGTAYPWVIGGQDAQQKQGSRQPGDDAAARTFASIRLAKLRVTAGLDQGDELSVAARIEKDASLPLATIEREIATLGQLGAQRPARPQRTASRAPSLAAPAAPMMAYASAASSPEGDAEDIFLD